MMAFFHIPTLFLFPFSGWLGYVASIVGRTKRLYRLSGAKSESESESEIPKTRAEHMQREPGYARSRLQRAVAGAGGRMK